MIDITPQEAAFIHQVGEDQLEYSDLWYEVECIEYERSRGGIGIHRKLKSSRNKHAGSNPVGSTK